MEIWRPKQGATPHHGDFIVWARGRTYEYHPDHGLIDYGFITPEHKRFCEAQCTPEATVPPQVQEAAKALCNL